MLRSPRRQPELTLSFVAPSGNCPGHLTETSPVSSAPIAKASPLESQFEKREEVPIYVAADLLGIAAEEIVRLCETGALHARRHRGGWRIDRTFLIQWRAANPNYYAPASGCESAQSLPCPVGACEAHWERRGRTVPAFRVDLCLSCYSGRPLPVSPPDDGDGVE